MQKFSRVYRYDPDNDADFDKIKQIQARTSFVNRPEVIEVRKIVEEIREGGNRALVKYISQFEYQPLLPRLK